METITLREGVSEQDARRWFDAVEGLVPELVSRLTDGDAETWARRILDFLLFGIARRE